MGHPPGAVWLPAPGFDALATDVELVDAWHGAPPAQLAELLRRPTGAPVAQLAAIAWVLDPTGGHVLLVRHATFGWSCPGGHVEDREDPADAASRELEEETGLALAPDDRRPVSASLASAPATTSGPAHDHWLLGYRFTATLDAVLRPERDPVAWHALAALPAPRPDDLAPLARIVGRR